MFFHVIVTSECNLQCKYCFGESLDDFDEDFGDNLEVDYDLPRKISYDVKQLREFCEKDPDCVLTFYGLQHMARFQLTMMAVSRIRLRVWISNLPTREYYFPG